MTTAGQTLELRRSEKGTVIVAMTVPDANPCFKEDRTIPGKGIDSGMDTVNFLGSTDLFL